ncbi:MAG: DUF2085 domain-containing protein [Candidatus Anstonellales archaeon]
MKAAGYWIYTIAMLVFALPIFITPLIGPSNQKLFLFMHELYGPTCHQLTSRSLCYFPANLTITNCFPTNEFSLSKQAIVKREEFGTGYKFPVCARDVGVYGAALLSALLYPLLFKKDNLEIPPLIFFIVAILPMAIDGGMQLIGVWESTNPVRVTTGAIAGFAMTFYAIPLLNRIFRK